MKILRIFSLISSFVLLTTGTFAGNISIVPQPLELKAGKGVFRLKPDTRLLIDAGNKEMRHIAKTMIQKINMSGGPAMQIEDYTPGMKVKNAIVFTQHGADHSLGKEGYILEVSKKAIFIRSVAANGIFYGTLTLQQLLPPDVEKTSETTQNYEVPAVVIRDMPRFNYRGMHLDVGRHMFPVSFIKEYIDLMAMYKLNTFHWHLTEDQGWRIEIKKYPRLTQVGSTRLASPKGRSGETDGIPYGGFYTQDQVREVVNYAASRFITVIPEIEMPGHSVAALTAYPALSCTGGPFQVRTQWGVADDILCAGKDSVFSFVEDVLTEVMALFPSTYIHIGGDEAPKVRWKACPSCQERIRKEGLKNEAELQSYFIRRVEKFLNSKGRKLIGWDEILEGGLAPEATVMSWRGMQGGVDAAQQGHDVIMTPTDYCYFDYYQANPVHEPEANGGLLTLKTVYSFEPVPPVLTPEQAKHILGPQGNVWTEYIETAGKVEYMAFPRAIALAEVAWSQKETRNWESFVDRMDNQYKRLDNLGVNYSKGSYQAEINTVYDKINHRNLVRISTEPAGCRIHYTVDGTEPGLQSPVYKEPFPLTSNATVKAIVVKNNEIKSDISERNISVNLASGKPVKIIQPYSYKYPGCGDQAITDGLSGTSAFKSGWQGYEGTDMESVVDLLQPVTIHKISATFLQAFGAWILYPLDVEFFTSTDGINWQPAGTIHTDPQPSKGKADREFAIELKPAEARYVKIFARNNGVLPSWHEYKGEKCWIFVDELHVE